MVALVDPFALEILDDPYDTYARWRAEAPLYRCGVERHCGLW
jgi:hypothetical protein